MGEDSKIEWTDHTFNGWIGCTKVSPACDFCYAELWGQRFGVEWGHGKPRRVTSDSNWAKPRAWNRKAEREGRRYRVFANSLSDWADVEVPDSWRDRLFGLIDDTPNLDWLLLTKRPQAAYRYRRHRAVRPNVWIGGTVENQEMLDLNLPKILDVPAMVHFLSIEPLLGPIELNGIKVAPGIDWVICGGESGPDARPMHPDWARSLRDQCQAAGVPFFFKQNGEWLPVGPVGSQAASEVLAEEREDRIAAIRSDGSRLVLDSAGDADWILRRVGKKAAGRLLDGCEWNEFPNEDAFIEALRDAP